MQSSYGGTPSGRGEVRSATVTFELVNAPDDRRIDTLEIPFVARED